MNPTVFLEMNFRVLGGSTVGYNFGKRYQLSWGNANPEMISISVKSRPTVSFMEGSLGNHSLC
jgi:hypothetical protein